MSEDPEGSGLNWYTYCANDPVNFIDPTGLVEVGLREYASTYPGAVVSWDAKTGTATVTWEGKTLSVISTSENNRDGHIYVDDSIFYRRFGVGTDTYIVYQDSVTQNISIRVAFNITGSGADMAIGTVTYGTAFLQGIMIMWSGTFGQYNVSTYAGRSSKGIKVTIVDGAGTSHQQPSWLGWSPSHPGSLVIYTHFLDGTLRTASEFRWVSAHEFGHILGLASSTNKGNFGDDMMGVPSRPVTANIIFLVLRAYQTKKQQSYI